MATESDILARARQFIVKKSYPEARSLLQQIPDNPTAQQWLTKLDAIAPAVPSATQQATATNDTLARAHQLIKRKQYTDARALLQQIPDNPTARQWLAQLDQIAPPPPPAPTLTLPPLPTEEPMDPNKIMMWRLYFTPIMMWKYTKNWARLGKPAWGTNTGWAGFLLFAWVIGSLIVLGLNLGSMLSIGFLITGAMTNLAFWIIIGHLQQGAYKTWIDTRDWEALRAHPYRVDKTIIGVIGVTAVATVVLTGWLWDETRDKTHIDYKDDSISLSYDRTWESFDTSSSTICQEYNYGCFLGLFDNWNGATMIFVKTGLAAGLQTSADAENYLWENFWYYPDIETIDYEHITVDGLPAVFREFGLPEFEDDPYYHMMVFVIVNGNDRYDITVWEVGRESLNTKRGKIMEVINSIDFK